jgi:hypothetical protein
MLLFVLFNKDCSKENMRKLLRASKPNPSLVLKFGDYMSLFGISTIMLELKAYFLARNTFGLYVNIR